MSIRLRDLIRNVRACKTAAEERACIAKECAAIRTAFKDEDNSFRHRNVAKLLFIHMLGYNTQFGQMECLKLIAAPSYPEKRLGYLGLNLLLDERQEVLMLVTNSLKNDLNHPNQYIAGLALCSLGNISSPEMARDLAPEVEKLLASSNPYVRKKAALCAIRIFRKVPELMDNFTERISSLLNDRNHAVLCTSVSMILEIARLNPSTLPHLRKLVGNLVRILKNLVLSGYEPEHDVGGICDPFLQVNILRLLRVLAAKDPEAADQMSDILAQVATNTETAKNAGNAILYECVLTIMGVESESGLRVLAINILGRFLTNRDNNIRYVALNTLAKVVSADVQAVQRHRSTIVDCLKDPDVSLRKRALELVYGLVNETTVRTLTKELLAYLVSADSEVKLDLTLRMCALVDKFAPTKRWHVDTLFKIITLAGSHVSEELSSSLIVLVCQSPELQAYAARKAYAILATHPSAQGVVQVCAWCVGEYGDLLVSQPPAEDEEVQVQPNASDVVDLLDEMRRDTLATIVTREYIVTALMKLTTRFQTYDLLVERIKDVLAQYKDSISVELQQRACEYTNLFQWDPIRPAVLERMPPLDEEQLKKKSMKDAARLPAPDDLVVPARAEGQAKAASSPLAAQSSLLDLDVLGGPAPAAAAPSATDVMADIFGGSPAAPAAAPTKPASAAGAGESRGPAAAAAAPKSNTDMLLDLLAPAAPLPASSASSLLSSLSNISMGPMPSPYGAAPGSLGSMGPMAPMSMGNTSMGMGMGGMGPAMAPMGTAMGSMAPGMPSMAGGGMMSMGGSMPMGMGSLAPMSSGPMAPMGMGAMAPAPMAPMGSMGSLGSMPMSTGGMGGMSMSSMPAMPSGSPPQPSTLLAGAGRGPMPVAQPAAMPSMGAAAAAPVVVPSNLNLVAFDKGGLKVQFELSKPQGAANVSMTLVNVSFSNANPSPLNAFVFQVAVPKYIKLQLSAASAPTLPPNSTGAVTQQIRLQNTLQGQKAIVMRVKIDYEQDGRAVSEQAEIANIPPTF